MIFVLYVVLNCDYPSLDYAVTSLFHGDDCDQKNLLRKTRVALGQTTSVKNDYGLPYSTSLSCMPKPADPDTLTPIVSAATYAVDL